MRRFILFTGFVLSLSISFCSASFVAYNDCIRGTDDTTAANTTNWTIYNNYTSNTSGSLIDFSTGLPTPVTATFTWNASAGLITSETAGSEDGISQPRPGTPAYAVFGGIVDFSNRLIYYGTSGWWVEVEFTGLSPSQNYSFVTTAIRASDYTSRQTLFTISNHLGADNNSSDGIESKDGNQSTLLAGGNHRDTTGYVVRWDNIRVADQGDGTGSFKVRAEATGADYRAYPFGGFMLEEISSNIEPTVIAGQDQTIHLPKEYLTLTGSVSDDGLGNPSGYLQSTWSQISGPDIVTFTTDVHQPEVTALFPAVGDYELQLTATDGEFIVSDTVMITVTDPICPVGDIDGDCIVQLADLSLLAQGWLESTSISASDLNGDRLVDIEELNLLGQSWLENWTGSLQVTISPTEAVTAGAEWRVDGSDWQTSGATVTSLPEGFHDIEYSLIPGWITPETQTVWIPRQQTTQALQTYSEMPEAIEITEFMAINSYLPYVNSMNIYTRYPWNGSINVYPDWIELHNKGTEPINLAGWYLTDDPDKLTKWQFPSDMGSELTLAPDAYLIVFASNKEQTLFPDNYPFIDYYGALHTNFELGASGEYLAVVASDGVTVSYEYNDYPAQFPFTSYGIAADDSVGYLTNPTPGSIVNFQWTGAANMGTSLSGKVGDTKFSHARGFYENAFDATISCATAGADIHYTLDGTEPQETVGGYTYLYSSPVPISATTCLRAKAFKAGSMPSNVDTQTYVFPDEVMNQVKPDDLRYATNWTQPADYTMEDDATSLALVAGNSGYTVEQAKAVIKHAMLKIPTVSIVSDPDGIFGSTNGIYTNSLNEGDMWERPVSAEYFNGDPNDTFQIDCGLKVQGGSSRNSDPKHSLSLRFSGGYGNATLKTDILSSQTSLEEFDSLQLRATYNNSWTHWDATQRSRGTLIRDQFLRDCLLAMGQKDAGAGRFVHLYINGLYWGVYNLHERPEASHYAAYYDGGDADYYDALNGGVPVDGSKTSWNNLTSLIQGSNSSSQADWEAICSKLDVENCIDWSILQCYARNQDLKSDGNWRAAGGGVFNAQWHFYLWDAERIMEDTVVSTTSTTSVFSPPFFLGYLDNFAEFRMQFADRVYQHFRNQGALTAASASTLFNNRVTELQDAIIGESARWGDWCRDVKGNGSYLYTKTDFWLTANSNINNYIQPKSTNAVNYFKNLSPALYPSIEPPVFYINAVERSGGCVPMPCTFNMYNANGVGSIYYTLDGNDPRAYWTGNISSTAILFDGRSVTLDKSMTVKARVRNGSVWSALHAVSYADELIASSLRVTELMYHPADPNLEFIELKNIGDEAINLNLVQFTKGIDHTFGNVTVGADGYLLLVKNKLFFEAAYPEIPAGVPVIQWDEGALDNNGDKVKFVDVLGQTVQSFTYKDGWYPLTDGEGFSLTVIDPFADPLLWDEKEGWRASTAPGGSPGTDEVGLIPDSIVINEVLAHSHETLPDWIELYNTTDQPISIGGWFLSDDSDNLTQYQIPQNTEIPAGGFVVFYENTHFGTAFALSENGETLYLTSGAGGQITGYQTSQSFDASERAISMGRYVTSTGNMDFVAMSTATPGVANTYPQVGPIVISEIQYNPGSGNTGNEYIELYNVSDQRVYLEDSVETEIASGVFENQTVSWSFTNGIEFTFPAGTSIEADGYLIVAKDVSAFNAYYTALPAGTEVLGPFANDTSLSNGDDKVRLCKPGEKLLDDDRSWIRVDQVNYDDESPWPVEADGQGQTLQRTNSWAYGNDPANWTAAAPSPGQ